MRLSQFLLPYLWSGGVELKKLRLEMSEVDKGPRALGLSLISETLIRQ